MKPFLAWPGWPHLGEAATLGLLQSAWWWIVYAGANDFTHSRKLRVPLHFDAELAIPFVPEMLPIYVSLNVLIVMAPFVLRTRNELRGLIVTLFLVTAAAGVSFLLLPAQPAYPAIEVVGFWSWPMRLNKSIVLDYNLAPSLHVAMSTVILAAFARDRGTLGRWGLTLWGILISLSTLLLHEHHVVDVVSGFLLGALGYRFVWLRWSRSAAETARSSPSLDRAPAA